MSRDSDYRGYGTNLSFAPHPSPPPSSRTRSHDQHQVNDADQSQQGFDTATQYTSHRQIENPSICLGGPLQSDCSDGSNTSTGLQLTGQNPLQRFSSLQEYQHIKERSRVSIERDLRRLLADLGYKQVDIETAVGELDNEAAVWDFQRQYHACDSQTHQRPSEPLFAIGSSTDEDSECKPEYRLKADA